LLGAAIGSAIEDFGTWMSHGGHERNWQRNNPNPNKVKTRCPVTGKKLPEKAVPKPPPQEPEIIPKGKGKGK
jgi:hypothetical protein